MFYKFTADPDGKSYSCQLCTAAGRAGIRIEVELVTNIFIVIIIIINNDIIRVVVIVIIATSPG